MRRSLDKSMIENVESWLISNYTSYERGAANMIPSGRQFRVGCLITVISLLIVGCAPSQENARDNVSIAEQDSKNKSTSKSEQHSSIKKELDVTSPDQLAEEVEKAEPKSKEEDVIVADEKDSTTHAEDSEFYQVTDAYDPDFPTLMGFTVNSIMDHVIDRFGKPLNESIMNDGTEPLQIYEYPGFVFGANTAEQIVFIEVNSTEVNPGLNNLHIGQNVEHARKSLGTPDSLNEYVMIYSSNNLIMKLDIDPNTSTIRSIKLFAE